MAEPRRNETLGSTAGARLDLRPSSQRGWFGGRRIEASGAESVVAGASLAEAAEALEAAYAGDGALVAALAAYDGTCTVMRFAEWREAPAPHASPAGSAPLLADATWDLSPHQYRDRVRLTRDAIAAGDVYVLNLTARLSGRLAAPTPEAAFEQLAGRAPADMAALLTGLPGATPWIASVSPERFVRVRPGEAGSRLVEVCPIKGTRPRGDCEAADAALAEELSADAKELAEHVMVVDLERNDIGVVCSTGTVHVDPLYEVVGAPYCHQLVSTVRGTLRHGVTFAELLAATFPCGSVTGAPKRAAMRIIGELEESPRGAYCGALLVAIPGELDSSVLIRTLEGDSAEEGCARWGAGCGITHDSDAAAEYLELLLKASPVTGDAPPTVALRETMRVAHGRVPLLDLHLARLASGGTGPSVLAKVRAEVARVLCEVDPALEYARLGVTVTPDGAVAAGVTFEPSSLEVRRGLRIAPVEIEAANDLPPNAAKPASRRFWDRAHRAAELAGAHQAILHLPDGTIVDGSTANVWLVREGWLLTPPAPPAVAGVARERIFDLAAELGISAEEYTLTLDDLVLAEEVLLSNAVGGLVAVHGCAGPVAERLIAAWRAATE